MPSFAGSTSGERRSALALAAVALAALVLSLLLAWLATLPRHPRAAGPAAVATAPPARFGAPPTAASAATPRPVAAPPGAASIGAGPAQPPTLWGLLTLPALVIDALAVAALAVVFLLRHALPGSRGARR
ncbi:MAG: hypothetical protein JO036_02290 [Candidatus Eremiobacteraeota bacterium]|nr:hypothetical protein [Candidatus Eremiobacteraeota bacterium]